MKIAFYAPLKSPDHPVPSGDRLMARLLIDALRRAGHEVIVASHLRAFLKEPTKGDWEALQRAAKAETERLAAMWERVGAPDLWFCYHPYYKAPDLVGADLCARFSIPFVTVEASYSARRNTGIRAQAQAIVLAGVKGAAVNISLTRRDREGLLEAAPNSRVELLTPFIDVAPFTAPVRSASPSIRLITVAMMRPGDKMDSYSMLAQALTSIGDRPWHLTIIGDGPCRDAVEAAFSALPPQRIDWRGQLPPDAIAQHLAAADLFVWPGCGEAYGLAYLEAQAAGLAVVAQRTAGVPEVVHDGETGLLVPPGDVDAYAAGISLLLEDRTLLEKMGGAARRLVVERHSLERASTRLNDILTAALRDQT